MRIKVHYPFFIASLLLFSCKNDRQTRISNNSVEYHKYTNALINETSPYLLKHAHNPVDWVTWSQSAFDLAKEQNKLVLISIGYSSCHWCSVMEKESFEDEDVAQIMNESYVNIKVDRDERPDIDLIYQTALQLVNDFGGWPLNAIILPNGKPVYLGTYHEKERWISVLRNFSKEYKSNPEKMVEYAELLAQGIQENYQLPNIDDNSHIPIDLFSESMNKWSQNWDLEWGGDKLGQKFIVPSKMELLLQYGLLNENQAAKSHFKNSMDIIAQSGIYDHFGGGFFRYTIDAEWKIPHFEKMLYDNAQLLSLYSKAFRVFKDAKYEQLVAMTFDFLQREMRSPQGGYYSSLDASINGIEGGFYTWSTRELESILSKEYKILDNYFGKTALDESPEQRYLVYPLSPDSIYTTDGNLTKKQWNEKLTNLKKSLFMSRKQREQPKKDDKIITSWNALLVNGFIEAYRAFGELKYLKAAEETFKALKNYNFIDGRPVHSYKANSRQDNVFLEDYAQLISCSWNLYKVSMNKEYLEFAKMLTQGAINEFGNPSSLFSYGNSENLIANVVDKVDGVMPSSNAIMARNLFELGLFDFNKSYMELSKNMVASMSSDLLSSPESYGQWGRLFLQNSLPFYEVVVIGPKANEFLKKLNEHFLPNTLIVGATEKSDSFLFKDRYMDGQTLLYVCMDNTCKLPVNTVEDALNQLQELGYKHYIQQVVPRFKNEITDFKNGGM